MKKEFKKSDLKSGMITKDSDNEIAIVIEIDGGVMLLYDRMRFFDHEINDDLELRPTGKGSLCGVITEVYSIIPNVETNYLNVFEDIDDNSCKLIWEREESIAEYTMEELTEKLGHNFKIKKD